MTRVTHSFAAVTLALAGLVTAQAQTSKPDNNFASRPAPPVSAAAAAEMQSKLDQARTALAANPNNPEAWIWVGRRLSYLGKFSEAIEVYTNGVAKFPKDARFYRHRGHRYITIRRFELAIADLEKAVELIRGTPDQIEPDGQPNARNIPTSTLQFNIWYHLGLAHYVKTNHEAALKAYRECLKVSRNPDALVATTHWLYMTLREMKREKEAEKVLMPIREDLDIIENAGYHRLLLMYKGVITPGVLLAEAEKQGASPGSHSILFGVGNWYVYKGQPEKGREIFRRMLATDQWTNFGYIAAEAQVGK